MHVLVIGCGLLGITTAWYLRQHGAEVTVVERAGGPALETSFANGALLHASLVEPWNSPGILWELVRWFGRADAPLLLRLGTLPSLASWGVEFLRNARVASFRRNTLKNLVLARYSLAMTRTLRVEAALEYGQHARGVARIYRDGAAFEAGVTAAAALEPYGLRHVRQTRDELIALEPALAPISAEIRGAIHFPDDEGGDAYLFCCALARAAKEAGVTFFFGREVTRLIASGGRVVEAVCRADRDQVRAEEIRADAFVLAAGSHSAPLAAPLGIALPIQPAKGYSITMSRGRGTAAPNLPVVDDALHAAVVPVGASRIRVAGTAEFAGYDHSIRRERIDTLWRLLERIYPALAAQIGRDTAEAWAGLRPMSADGVPILGATALENFFLNTGHGHLGWTLAAGSGRLVADLVTGRAPAIDAKPYALARFASPGS